jgi:hypothetical protein
MANTSLIGLTLPATGTLSGQWGDTINNAISQIIDVAVAGTQTISADADITLSLTTGTYASTGLTGNSSQYAVILWTAGGTATRTITVPAQSKTYVVINKTSSTQSIIVQGVTGTGVTVAAGTRAIVAWDGTNFVNVTPYFVNGVLPVANGGTGLASGTSGGVLSYTASGTLASSGALAASALVIGGGAGAAPSTTTTATGALTFLGTPSSANLAALVTDETGSGSLVFGTTPTITTAALTNPTVTNYVETPFSANSSTAITLALTNGTVQIITLTGNATITMPTAVSGKSFMLLLKTGSGGYTVTWSTVNWPSGTAPTLTSTASKMDKFVFTSDGTYWYGSIAGQAYSA